MNLLIINDEELTVRFLLDKINWNKHGIARIYKAYNVEEAKAVLNDAEIDILLCDIEMPGDNGIDFLRWVQEEGLDCDCVFLTCHADFHYIHEALHLECRDYILYPSPAEDIGLAVEKTVERRRERRRKEQLSQFGQQWVASHQMHLEDAAEVRDGASKIIDCVMAYIMDNISDHELSVSQIAEKNFISLGYLSRLFKREKGISVSQYIVEKRMELAAELIKKQKGTITEIAEEVGYRNYPHFTSTFKKQFGQTPSDFQKNMNEKGSVRL